MIRKAMTMTPQRCEPFLSEAIFVLLHRYFVRELEFTQNSETINAIVYFQIGIQLVDKAACHCETRLIAIYLEM